MDRWVWPDLITAGIELSSLIFLSNSNVHNDRPLILFSCFSRWLFALLFILRRMLSLLLLDNVNPEADIGAVFNQCSYDGIATRYGSSCFVTTLLHHLRGGTRNEDIQSCGH